MKAPNKCGIERPLLGLPGLGLLQHKCEGQRLNNERESKLCPRQKLGIFLNSRAKTDITGNIVTEFCSN
jgi:hypothetical protein